MTSSSSPGEAASSSLEGASVGQATVRSNLVYHEKLQRHRRPGLLDLFCFNRKYLVYNLVMRNLKLRYRKSFFGIFWTVLIPAVNALVYFAIFQFVMRVQIDNYLLFVLSGLIPWTFFSGALLSAMESLVWNHSILNKVPIPPYAFPLTEVLTAFINFLAAIPVLLIVALLTKHSWSWATLLFLYPLAMVVLQAYGIGLILSYGNVYFRDLRHLMGVVLQIWFYLTPIIYAPTMIPEAYRFLMYLNPVGFVFESFHGFMMGYEVKAEWFWVPPLWVLVIGFLSYRVVRRYNAMVVESV